MSRFNHQKERNLGPRIEALGECRGKVAPGCWQKEKVQKATGGKKQIYEFATAQVS